VDPQTTPAWSLKLCFLFFFLKSNNKLYNSFNTKTKEKWHLYKLRSVVNDKSWIMLSMVGLPSPGRALRHAEYFQAPLAASRQTLSPLRFRHCQLEPSYQCSRLSFDRQPPEMIWTEQLWLSIKRKYLSLVLRLNTAASRWTCCWWESIKTIRHLFLVLKRWGTRFPCLLWFGIFALWCRLQFIGFTCIDLPVGEKVCHVKN